MITKPLPMRALALAAGLAVMTALPMAATTTLPAPYVSRALDALLIPVDDSVRSAFGLPSEDAGVMVMATAPGGVAEGAGIKAGDIIGRAFGQDIQNPIDLDTLVYYWLNKGTTDFGFDVWQNGVAQYVPAVISQESYMEVIDVTTITTWTSYTSESFSYEEYTSEYSETISESYSESESLIEETASSEEYSSQQTEETANDDANLDTDQDGTPDVSDTDDDNDGTADLADEDANGDGADDDGAAEE
jgi:hypothetical protein